MLSLMINRQFKALVNIIVTKLFMRHLRPAHCVSYLSQTEAICQEAMLNKPFISTGSLQTISMPDHSSV